MGADKNKDKRVTIYDIARDLGISASYVSRALNNYPTTSKKILESVTQRAKELNYKHNTFAANLRKGTSRNIGVIVPKINESFFSNVIAGIESVCRKHHHHVIICQSEESYRKEIEAVNLLINQSVDCILISLSIETKTTDHLNEIIRNNIKLIQFDRYNDEVPGFIVTNNNRTASFEAVTHLVNQGYKKIAFIGGPKQVEIFNQRKLGFIEAVEELRLKIPKIFYEKETLTRERARDIAIKLLKSNQPPDAFFTSSDYAAIGVLEAAKLLNLSVPEELGIVGFQNEEFSSFVTPSLSSIDQKPREMGSVAANLYFTELLKNKRDNIVFRNEVVDCSLLPRDTSVRAL